MKVFGCVPVISASLLALGVLSGCAAQDESVNNTVSSQAPELTTPNVSSSSNIASLPNLASSTPSSAASSSVSSMPEPTSPEPEPPVLSPDALSAQALQALQEYLDNESPMRAPLNEQSFAKTALTQADALTAQEMLWLDLGNQLAQSRASEIQQESIAWESFTLRYKKVSFGDALSSERSLFISMHGGGQTTAAANDKQWQNQIALGSNYAPTDALWVAARAPTDTWNMWFQNYMDPLLDRLITNMLITENINPNRVYLTGYSAGGDGAYQLAPRMADRWAGVQMSAGHPNGVPIENVRNLAFSLHVGGNDTAFDRHKEVPRYGDMLAKLKAQDPTGYKHQAIVHAGLPHWMNLADKVGVPFIQAERRNPETDTVVWTKFSTVPARFYWLAHQQPTNSGAKVTAKREGNSILISQLEGFKDIVIYLRNDMVDFSAPVTVIAPNGDVLFNGKVERTLGSLATTLNDRQDPAMMYSAKITIDLP